MEFVPSPDGLSMGDSFTPVSDETKPSADVYAETQIHRWGGWEAAHLTHGPGGGMNPNPRYHASPKSKTSKNHRLHQDSTAMSLSIDLTTHGKRLQQVYSDIISNSPETSWAVFSYDKGASNELKVQATGSTLHRGRS
jgi:hypothetical protein